ncbi:hypothetical protein OR1_04134 [Geobacter sp. OR-1]|nr:hypothetical protein OR1_04134 [Geobacter sp. OR-1]
MATVGAVISFTTFTDTLAVPILPAASYAFAVIMYVPVFTERESHSNWYGASFAVNATTLLI